MNGVVAHSFPELAMRTQLRIVAGALRGRKLHCTVGPHLRPMPDMVRQALFSILGDAVPERPFIDLFAGTGAVGLEALSRGAKPVYLVERDARVAKEILSHLKAWDVVEQVEIQRADAYRWAETWFAPTEPVNIFLGPPYPDYAERLDRLQSALQELQRKTAVGSVLVLQADRTSPPQAALPDAASWEERSYGRTRLLLWVKQPAATLLP